MSFIVNYIGILMLWIDVYNMLFYQRDIVKLFADLQHLDEEMQRNGMQLNNNSLKSLIFNWTIFMILYEILSDLIACVLVYNIIGWVNIFLFLAALPRLYNSMNIVWYLGLLAVVRQRFQQINAKLNDMAQAHEVAKKAIQIECAEKETYQDQIKFSNLFGKIINHKISPGLHFNPPLKN